MVALWMPWIRLRQLQRFGTMHSQGPASLPPVLGSSLGTDIIFEFGPNLKSTNQRPKVEITDVHKSAPPFTRVAGGVDLDFASTAVLRIEQFSGLTKWESDQKAKARINVLLGE